MTSRKLCGAVVIGLIVLSSSYEPVHARSGYGKAFNALYEKEYAGVTEATKCSVCHVGKDKKVQNNYGKAVTEALDAKNVTDMEKIKAALRTAEEKPSDVEGKTFGDLIKEGRLPDSK